MQFPPRQMFTHSVAELHHAPDDLRGKNGGELPHAVARVQHEHQAVENLRVVRSHGEQAGHDCIALEERELVAEGLVPLDQHFRLRVQHLAHDAAPRGARRAAVAAVEDGVDGDRHGEASRIAGDGVDLASLALREHQGRLRLGEGQGREPPDGVRVPLVVDQSDVLDRFRHAAQLLLALLYGDAREHVDLRAWGDVGVKRVQDVWEVVGKTDDDVGVGAGAPLRVRAGLLLPRRARDRLLDGHALDARGEAVLPHLRGGACCVSTAWACQRAVAEHGRHRRVRNREPLRDLARRMEEHLASGPLQARAAVSLHVVGNQKD
mmetsp:Transcript_68048/g.177074  ORF Transcript_68048/g.177074 Transcript_68048/m.177074 type:complete len:321 (+) Transcript_68048:207-1169(+)